jgi:septum formation protein
MSNFIHQHQPLILASGSQIRAKLLQSLGLDFLIIPSHCDETLIKNQHKSNNVADLGFALATSKALTVSQQHPNHWVLAADQLCVIENKILDKPLNHETAVQHLHSLSGKKHQQMACLCLAYNNEIVWKHHEVASLTMHHLSDEVIESYLRIEQPYQSCGAYQFETFGKWLFKEVDGHEDTILGLSLMALTNALMELEIIQFTSLRDKNRT